MHQYFPNVCICSFGAQIELSPVPGQLTNMVTIIYVNKPD